MRYLKPSLVTIILLLFTLPIFSKTDITIQKYWSSIGVGLSYFKHNMGVTGKLDGCIQLERFLLQTRYILNYEYNILDLLVVGEKHLPRRYVNDIGLLCGFMILDSRIIDLTISGGCSINFGKNRGDLIEIHESALFGDSYHYKSDNYITFGVPLDFQFRFTGGKNIGVGFTLGVNINNRLTYICGLVTFTIGKLKSIK